MKNDRCVFTIVNNELEFFPIWLKYYSQHFSGKDIYVLDHNSDGQFLQSIIENDRDGLLNRVAMNWNEYYNHDWLLNVVSTFQRFLLSSYDKVLFVEVDEIIAPRKTPLSEYLSNFSLPFVKTMGYNVFQRIGEDATFDRSRSVMDQRFVWKRCKSYDKPLLSKVPLDYSHGFHKCQQGGTMDPDLILLHLRNIEVDWVYKRQLARASGWSPMELERKMGWHNRPMSYQDQVKAFVHGSRGSTPIDPDFRNLI